MCLLGAEIHLVVDFLRIKCQSFFVIQSKIVVFYVPSVWQSL